METSITSFDHDSTTTSDTQETYITSRFWKFPEEMFPRYYMHSYGNIMFVTSSITLYWATRMLRDDTNLLEVQL